MSDQVRIKNSLLELVILEATWFLSPVQSVEVGAEAKPAVGWTVNSKLEAVTLSVN